MISIFFVFMLGLKRRKSSIKEVLLAGDVVVGVGNIYACEVLFSSRHQADPFCCRAWQGAYCKASCSHP
jgi:hypothetical protein